jgi:hypothetical protein
MTFCWVKDCTGHGLCFAIVHASIENRFLLNTKFCVKDVIDAHDKMDGGYHEMYFAEKLLPNLPPLCVFVVNSASDHSRKREQ